MCVDSLKLLLLIKNIAKLRDDKSKASCNKEGGPEKLLPAMGCKSRVEKMAADLIGCFKPATLKIMYDGCF